jgi:hypothetical protein
MAMVMIRCPTTGHQTFTGIETDATSVNLIPPINARLKCPRCGDTHIWSILDAELVVREFECVDEVPSELKSQLAKLG